MSVEHFLGKRVERVTKAPAGPDIAGINDFPAELPRDTPCRLRGAADIVPSLQRLAVFAGQEMQALQ